MKREKAKNLVGICGIYCGTCPQFLASRENDREMQAKIAREHNIPIAEAYCDGCLSDHVISFCKECRHGFRACAREKGVTWCFECADFACPRLRAHKDQHIVNGVSHHENIINSLRYMKEHGIEAWVEQQDKAGRCPECGKRLYWFTRVCPGCHAELKR